MKEIMVTNYNKGMFQSKNLNTATEALVKAANGINKNIKTMCVVLWRVLDTKAYEEEGMKSLAEYADRIGFDKSLAHKYADAGKLYDSDNETIKAAVADMDFTKVQLLKSVPEETVKTALETGAVNPDMTVDAIKTWKSNQLPSGEAKDKVLKNFRVCIVKDNGDTIDYDSIALEAVVELQDLIKCGSYKELSSIGGKETGRVWDLYVEPSTGHVMRVWKTKVEKKSAKTKKSEKEISKEDLIALAAKYGMKVSF